MINRPQPDEYSAYAARYVDLVGDGNILNILENQKESTFNFFLRKMGQAKADYAYAEGKWTVKQVLGHMIDTERVFAFRALAFSREPTELPGFDQDVYMAKSTFGTRSLDDIAGEYKIVRESSLYLFKSMSGQQLTQKGIATGNPVSVRALAYMIAGHELHHIKVMEERYLLFG
jgi:hypothetical protein